jgi:hypothetical protein
MHTIKILHLIAGMAMVIGLSNPLRAEPTLGDAPRAPADVSGLPGGGPHPNSVTGGFSVDTTSREQVRSFYNAVYTSSSGTPINSTADQSNCVAGTNSPAFAEVTLRRINWFRAMAGLSAAVTFDSGESAKDQQAAVIMSSNNKLQHTGVWTTWTCITSDGTNAAGNSNLALGIDGPDAITGYIWDYGTNNFDVGHRRNLLYPQTQIMATGDVPQENTLAPANATWVFDANYFGQRPTTRNPYVAWPPPGYVPYQVVYPQWSFALSNADLSAATVSMQSNGVPVAVTIQPYVTGYGEDTLVWYPTSLDPTTANTIFPFSGTDTVYSITVSNVVTGAGTQNFTYNVTAFDPSVPGADYFPPTISGTAQPAVNAANPYVCTGITNATSYQWLVAQGTNGNLSDGAENGLVNFTATTTAGYYVITNGLAASGTFSFHLAQPLPANQSFPVDQILQLNESLLPATNTSVTFQSLLGYASTSQIAEVQASSDGVNWQNLYSQPGTNGPGESAFTAHALSLSNYAGAITLLRFNYHFNTGGSGTYFPQTSTSPAAGWFLDNIVITNTSQLVNLATNATASTNFTFTPVQTGSYDLFAGAIIFTQFPLAWGPVKQVTAIAAPPVITLNTPFVSGNQVQLNFSVSGTASTFKLLQEDQLNGTWITNSSATFTTNVPGTSYRFTATGGTATRFYRIQSP